MPKTLNSSKAGLSGPFDIHYDAMSSPVHLNKHSDLCKHLNCTELRQEAV